MNILKEIKPSKEEEKILKEKINIFLNKLNKKLKFAKAILGGSFAKNTWLRGKYDVDIFVKFNYKKYKNKSSELSKILEKYLKSLNYSKLHGSRDYFQVKQGKLIFELVPVLDIKKANEALNVTDVSPLHALYVKNNSNKKIQDEIRLVKQFCIANNLYGAESYIKGFSGYVIEVLTIYYKSFNNLIKNITRWHDKVILAPKKYYKNNEEALRNLNISKIYSPLIIVDPVQKDRNIAAAVSKERFDLFRKVARNYIKNPNEKFFIKKEIDINKLKGYHILEITSKKGKKDIIGSKILKVLELIKKKLDLEGFKVKDFGWKWDSKAYLWFKVKNKTLSKYKKHYGPPIDRAKELINFKKKWKKYKIYKEKNRVYINLQRKYTKINDFLKFIIKDKLIKTNITKIKLKSKGL